jgi:late competence protein required for DNA uptake (superfamily II DNA/RNA helicase)
MKATLYAIHRTSGWEARLSVDWPTDRLYWTSADFRREAESGWREGGPASGDHEGAGRNPDAGRDVQAGATGHAGCYPAQWEQLLWLKRQIPLGRAEAACAKLSGIKQHTRGMRWQTAWLAMAEEVFAGTEKLADAETPVVGRIRSGASANGSVGGQAEDACNHGLWGREDVREMGKRARLLAERLRGRNLLLPEVAALCQVDASACLPLLQLASLLGGLKLAAAVSTENRKRPFGGWGRRNGPTLRCRRCGSGDALMRRTACATCGSVRCAYCEACLSMGRARECGLLVIGLPCAGYLQLSGIDMDPAQVASRWGLNAPQQEAALAALRFMVRPPKPVRQRPRWKWGIGFGRNRCRPAAGTATRSFLFWAVTGAGKTEMIFPLLAIVIAAGGRAAVATPRRDVVLELAPRLAAAFPEVRRVVLHGGSGDRFASGALTIATTHQLMRFREAFDLVVMDEVDAFPYHNNPMLHHAAAQALAQDGFAVLLSATPSPELQRRVRLGVLPCARVAVRYHRHPLPVPRRLILPPLQRWLSGQTPALPAKLLGVLQHSVRRGAQTFLFVPYIRQVEPLVRLLREHAAALDIAPASIDGTSSRDPARMRKVADFRERTIRLLVTTTILERGVTIPRSDIVVLEADNPLFDAAALVQMAGRAGRSAADPAGFVHFAASAWTRSQREACRQIRAMNAYARKRGELVAASGRKGGDRPCFKP